MIINPTEKQIENLILNYLRAKGFYAWKNQSIGVFDPVKKIYRKSNNRHHIKGVSDIIALKHGKAVFIEVKSKTGRPSQEQIVFMNNIKSVGGIAFIARSIEDVLNELKTHNLI